MSSSLSKSFMVALALLHIVVALLMLSYPACWSPSGCVACGIFLCSGEWTCVQLIYLF